MGGIDMEIDQILQILQAVSDSEVEKFALEEGNLKLQIRKADKRTAAEAVCLEEPRKAERKEQKETGVQIKAPLVGTFYTAPSPEEENFVQVGDHVEKGQTLGIIEAMKLMNEIQSEKEGIVKAVLVENEQLVEYGQPLFLIG